MTLTRLAGTTALVAWAVTLMVLLLPPHPASDVDYNEVIGGYSATISYFDLTAKPKYDFPIASPLVAVIVAAVVALGLRAAARHAPEGVRGVLALNGSIGVGSLVPAVWKGGTPLLCCVSDLHAAILLVAFSAFWAAGRYALETRWWAAVVLAPAVLGLIRFGVECPTGLGVVAAGPVLGLVATGVLAGRTARPTGA